MSAQRGSEQRPKKGVGFVFLEHMRGDKRSQGSYAEEFTRAFPAPSVHTVLHYLQHNKQTSTEQRPLV